MRALLLLLLSCGPYREWKAGRYPIDPLPEDDPATEAELVARIILVGDAGWGNGRAKGDPGNPCQPDCALSLVQAAAARNPKKTFVVYLGDNIYGEHTLSPLHGGMPEGVLDDAEETLAERAAGDMCAMVDRFSLEESQLMAQLDPVRQSGAWGIFVPGNHDYYAGGWEAVERQERFIAMYNAAYGLPPDRIRLLPRSRCPAPALVQVGDSVAIIAIDTAFWLADQGWFKRPVDVSPGCFETPYERWDEGLERLQTTLSQAFALAHDQGRKTILVAHHPYRSYGSHGRRGEVYSEISQQETNSPRVREMMDAIRTASESTPGPELLFAAGHDHTLQVLDGRDSGFRYLAVSGNGSMARAETEGEVWWPGTEMADFISSRAGFMVIEVFSNGSSELHVLEAIEGEAGCQSQLAWELDLVEAPPPPADPPAPEPPPTVEEAPAPPLGEPPPEG